MARALEHPGLTTKAPTRYMCCMNDITASFDISAAAAARVAEILADDPSAKALRVEVLAGGCSGLQYKFDLTDARTEEDLVLERDGATVFVDPVSLDFLAGAELDFKDSLMGAHFLVKNPNATASCGCGTSFSID
ncbi:Iron-sulfur cluster assembly accessory protein [Acidocella aminolytica 101 = DSM 11237]|uniref:Iron-sulfur (Fe-S) cluster assembly protein n=2 Tax=Acidocella TaxID=50709 RepID=A0A0D6PC21_9PROT|nr:iron-sulfur (Fe-S) cluster assembly protein [Acidocella aminolytica 101 = DSM 11237]GBQ42248.1 iron-sulfur cluster assembly protein HesB/YadR/YfhF [Acidocella aminolytica 101 = DSM 11237]SHE99078.1 Iron-sulfur cluster assembly accessory protein [Acidocella aminolytica 101 = DSM 11237]